jgi:trimethylamine---corrinoid protein Co-methyltransferase
MTAIQPKLELLTYELIARILDEAFQLMQKPGIKVQSAEARDLLIHAGATADGDVLNIPEKIVRTALETVPADFYLYDRGGNPKVHYGGDSVHFDPGSSGVHILDPETLEHKTSYTADLVRLVKVAEMLPQYAAQSTALSVMKSPKPSVTCTGSILSCCFLRNRSLQVPFPSRLLAQ